MLLVCRPESYTCCQSSHFRAPSLTGGSYSVETQASLSPDELAAIFNQACLDKDSAYDFELFRMVGLANAIGRGDGTCKTACTDPFRPLCRNGVCAPVSCKLDAKPHCNEDTTAGLYARLLCSQTCGCHLPDSSLVYSLRKYGCPPSCRDVPEYRARLARVLRS